MKEYHSMAESGGIERTENNVSTTIAANRGGFGSV